MLIGLLTSLDILIEEITLDDVAQLHVDFCVLQRAESICERSLKSFGRALRKKDIQLLILLVKGVLTLDIAWSYHMTERLAQDC